METDRVVREHLLKLIRGGEAHITLEDIVADFPLARIGDRVSNIPYSPWEVLEHIRIAQWDILEFSRNSQHVSPEWPKGYWPDPQKTPTEADWSRTLAEIASDKTQLENMINDETISLYAPIPHGTGQTVLREILLVADHNAYHIGVLNTLKRALS